MRHPGTQAYMVSCDIHVIRVRATRDIPPISVSRPARAPRSSRSLQRCVTFRVLSNPYLHALSGLHPRCLLDIDYTPSSDPNPAEKPHPPTFRIHPTTPKNGHPSGTTRPVRCLPKPGPPHATADPCDLRMDRAGNGIAGGSNPFRARSCRWQGWR